jgi:hypothetical protein
MTKQFCFLKDLKKVLKKSNLKKNSLELLKEVIINLKSRGIKDKDFIRVVTKEDGTIYVSSFK